MGITDRKQRQKEEVRTSILETAWEMIVTEGWQSFSIRKVADAIEYSVPVIYSHFENKDAILLEFNRKGFELLAEALAKAKAGILEFRLRQQGILPAHVRAGNPHL
jgi:AcrR family transcriptional regulator